MEIVGNKNIISYLEKAAENNSLAQTYIFCGPKSVGKARAAEWIAEKLLKTVANRLHTNPDFLKMEQGSIGKEDIDMAINWLSLSPYGGFCKILVINNAEQMSVSAANAFLKTLEEPAKRAIIILITSQLGRLLPTIISRSVVLKFKTASKDEIFDFLKNYGAKDAKKYVNLSGGKPGRAVELIENPKKVSESREDIEEFKELFFGGYPERFAIAGKISTIKGEAVKEKIAQKIDFWLEVIRDILLLKYSLNDSPIYIKDCDLLNNISGLKPAGYFASLGERLIKMKQLLGNNINFKLMLENLII